MDDQAIVLAFQQGDREKFGLLYDKYIEKIYNFIFYKTFHKETAEDLAQKTFFKALASLDKTNPQSLHFSAWLYSIARNNLIDHYRTAKKTYDISEARDLPGEDNPEKAIGDQHQLEQVRKYLDKLTPEQKEIIIMRIWDGLSYKEISDILGVKEANLKMVFSRALKKLKEKMPAELFTLLLIQLVKF